MSALIDPISGSAFAPKRPLIASHDPWPFGQIQEARPTAVQIRAVYLAQLGTIAQCRRLAHLITHAAPVGGVIMRCLEIDYRVFVDYFSHKNQQINGLL